jgi:hypothetical protein
MAIPAAVIAQTSGDGIVLGGPTEPSAQATQLTTPVGTDIIPIARPGNISDHFITIAQVEALPLAAGAFSLSVDSTNGLIVVGLPTSDPHVVGALWLNSHVLTASAG